MDRSPAILKHERPLFPKEETDRFHDYRLSACPECNHSDVVFVDQPPRVI